MRDKKPDQTNAINRRQHFRLDDDVLLAYHLTDRPAIQPDQDVPFLTMATEFAALDQSAKLAARELGRRLPATGDYLNALHNQIRRLSEALVIRELAQFGGRLTRASLSVSGIGFAAERPFQRGQLLELRLVLLPSLHGIITVAEVIGCQAAGGTPAGAHRVSLKFLDLPTQYADTIARHLLQKEADLLRQKHDGTPPPA
ncbi:MAG TPA: hypothetical protein ENJ19_06630 [Gammaproteobacteria bacterium]|nr:hypothetical protein [Gammaproteobacteria bacterium]